MVRIKITRDGNYIKKITFEGHAGYDLYGKDIVCAAVSATMLCTVNAILSFNEKAVSFVHDKDINVLNVLSWDDVTVKLIENMIRCFESLEKEYPKNIEIK